MITASRVSDICSNRALRNRQPKVLHNIMSAHLDSRSGCVRPQLHGTRNVLAALSSNSMKKRCADFQVRFRYAERQVAVAYAMFGGVITNRNLARTVSVYLGVEYSQSIGHICSRLCNPLGIGELISMWRASAVARVM